MFVDGTITAGCPTTVLFLVLEVSPLINGTTWERGFPLVVEDMGESEVDLGFGTEGLGMDIWPRS